MTFALEVRRLKQARPRPLTQRTLLFKKLVPAGGEYLPGPVLSDRTHLIRVGAIDRKTGAYWLEFYA